MNGGGWRVSSSVQAYKTFLRPMIEYGLQLEVPMHVLDDLQKTQNEVLRGMLSTQRNTSIGALHGLTGLEPIRIRAARIRSQYMERIRSEAAKSTPIGKAMKKNRRQVTVSSIGQCRKLVSQAIMDMDTKTKGYASSVAFGNGINKHLLMIENVVHKDLQWLLRDWRLGKMIMNRTCRLCYDTLNRTDCMHIDDDLAKEFTALHELWKPLEDEEYFMNYLLNLAETEWRKKDRDETLIRNILHRCGITVSKIVEEVASGKFPYKALWNDERINEVFTVTG
jgi:hypothetical protein